MAGHVDGWMDGFTGRSWCFQWKLSTAIRIVQWSKPFHTPAQPLRSGWIFQKKHGDYIQSLNGKVIVIIQLNKRWTDRSQSTPNSNKMVSHMLHHNGDVMHICSECKISFRCAELRSHTVTHSKGKAYNCVQCHKSFGQAGHLNMHMTTHSSEKTYTCIQCQKSFGKTGNLKRHMLSEHCSPTVE